VAVDIRVNSPTFGKWVAYELSDENMYMLYIPPGFAHGFLTLSENAELLYKATNEYNQSLDRGILYNDPLIGIKWPEIKGELIISPKDQKQPLLNAAQLK
jgi:dTDP-4-dehydrorhamnose 3,5-epimerase